MRYPKILRVNTVIQFITTFNKYMCNWTLEVRDILKILWKTGEEQKAFCEKLKLDYNLSLHSPWELALDQSMASHKVLLEQRHIQSTLVISIPRDFLKYFEISVL